MRSTEQIRDTILGSFHIFMHARDNIKHHNVSFPFLHIHDSLTKS